jgi:hypothetical protein
MVRFTKEDNIYKVNQFTGNQNNILGISFADKPSNDQTIEVVEWYFLESDRTIIRTSKEEVLQQVLAGLKSLNEDLGTDYQVSKIYYDPSEDGSELVYRTLFRMLLKHYHSGNEFEVFRHGHNRTIGLFKDGNIYKISRIIDNREDIFGISFAEKTNPDPTIEVVEWNGPKSDSSEIEVSKEEVRQQVLSALKSLNRYLGTKYQLSKIYYRPLQHRSARSYRTFLRGIIQYYHSGTEFEEWKD